MDVVVTNGIIMVMVHVLVALLTDPTSSRGAAYDELLSTVGTLSDCNRYSVVQETTLKPYLKTAAHGFIKAIMLGKKKWSALVQQVCVLLYGCSSTLLSHTSNSPPPSFLFRFPLHPFSSLFLIRPGAQLHFYSFTPFRFCFPSHPFPRSILARVRPVSPNTRPHRTFTPAHIVVDAIVLLLLFPLLDLFSSLSGGHCLVAALAFPPQIVLPKVLARFYSVGHSPGLADRPNRKPQHRRRTVFMVPNDGGSVEPSWRSKCNSQHIFLLSDHNTRTC